MTWKAIPILLTALASIGCVKTTDGGSYCDLAGPLYFDSDEVVTWLFENDPTLLKEIIIDNETWAELCGGRTSP